MEVASYVAGRVDEYLYPSLGDERPPGGAKVLLLTKGGICIVGQWRLVDESAGYVVGWAPLPKRDHAREALFKPVSG
jgi:hypothetical protein